jgi:hypothetical protein
VENQASPVSLLNLTFSAGRMGGRGYRLIRQEMAFPESVCPAMAGGKKGRERGNPGLVIIFKFALESFPCSTISPDKEVG